MELENSNEALFNSSTEFLISFNSADETKLGKPDGRCEDSSAVKVCDETLLPVKTADSEHIVCEFADDGCTDLFASRDTGAGAGDPWLPLSCVTAAADVHADAHEVLTAGDGDSESSEDRKLQYVKHGVDTALEFSASARDATDITLLELADASHSKPSDTDHNVAVQFPSSVFPADQQFTNELDSASQDRDIFLEFGTVSYVVSENPDISQTAMTDSDYKKVDGADSSQHMQLFKPFPDSGEFTKDLNAGEHDSLQQGHDTFLDFRAVSYIACENTNSAQTLAVDGGCKEMGNADDNQSMQFLFTNFDKPNERLNTVEQLSTPVPVTAPASDQQPVKFGDEVLLENHEISTSLPDVHSAAVNKELIAFALPDQLFSEEISTADVTAERSELSQPAAGASDTVFIDEIQV